MPHFRRKLLTCVAPIETTDNTTAAAAAAATVAAADAVAASTVAVAGADADAAAVVVVSLVEGKAGVAGKCESRPSVRICGRLSTRKRLNGAGVPLVSRAPILTSNSRSSLLLDGATLPLSSNGGCPERFLEPFEARRVHAQLRVETFLRHVHRAREVLQSSLAESRGEGARCRVRVSDAVKMVEREALHIFEEHTVVVSSEKPLRLVNFVNRGFVSASCAFHFWHCRLSNASTGF
eukprot:CAMPEP_0171696588 /NCGR_PEP_ID=MMETSP0991-20121206/8371_1 /TAXON_ID=483369 /ORGANISM="non described non described, Strain CCMP2098" /LENGTH=235 /DNA_ID=CAMNT_0012285331 /DNA_START=14 /DNA_END=719 /DNA_ORIENTATION=+